MYARVHGAFVERTFVSVALTLGAAEALFALLSLVAGDWLVLLYQVAGIGAIALAVKRHEAEQPGARFLIFAGSLAVIAFLYVFALPLSFLALSVWGLLFVLSYVE